MAEIPLRSLSGHEWLLLKSKSSNLGFTCHPEKPCRTAQPMMYARCDEVHPFVDVSLSGGSGETIERDAGHFSLRD